MTATAFRINYIEFVQRLLCKNPCAKMPETIGVKAIGAKLLREEFDQLEPETCGGGAPCISTGHFDVDTVE